eukprot:7069221-Pyramimonas_sp.AAC.1
MHRIARLIAGGGRRPRGRVYRAATSTANVHHWIDKMAKPGPEGGCRSTELASEDLPPPDRHRQAPSEE